MRLPVSDTSAVERSGAAAHFVVTLAPPQDTPVTVNFTTGDGTASAGLDYQSANGQLTFASGVTEQAIAVAVNSDSLVERVEGFTVGLSGASGSPIVRAQATGLIFDPGVFFTVEPCRAIDTRGPVGPYGGPALFAKTQGSFALAGRCELPRRRERLQAT